MPLYCDDGTIAVFKPWYPLPVVKTGQVRPAEHVDRDRCQRCGRVGWQHWTVRP